MLTLYFEPGTSSMAAHIALHEVDVPFEGRPISLKKGDHRTPQFLALNPEGKIPLLLIDGRPLTEVAAILYYLARSYPAANLMPRNDPEAEAQVISWMSFVASTIHWEHIRGMDPVPQAYKLADQRLGHREWAIGQYSIADIHLFRLFWRFSNSVKPPAGAFPNLFRHHDQMMKREAVQRTCEIEAAIGYELVSLARGSRELSDFIRNREKQGPN